MMSLAPPPVTPSRKLPPFLGVPPPVPVDVLPPQAAITLAIDRPAASMPMPTRSCRRVIFPRRYIYSRVDLSSIYSLTSICRLTPSQFRGLLPGLAADQAGGEAQVLGDEDGRPRIPPPQCFEMLLVLARISR